MEMSFVSVHKAVGETRSALANIIFLCKIMFCDSEIAVNFAITADILWYFGNHGMAPYLHKLLREEVYQT